MKLLFVVFSSSVWLTKKGFFGSNLSVGKINNLVGNTLETNDFKIEKKTAYQTSQN